MLAKLAVLFLVGMVVMALFLARPKRGDGSAKRGRRDRARLAAKCPDCGSWIVEGARCPCREKGGRA